MKVFTPYILGYVETLEAECYNISSLPPPIKLCVSNGLIDLLGSSFQSMTQKDVGS